VVDFRYHALSLVAVFLALGIGIVLGVTVGDSLVSDADRNLRDSLRGDVTEARQAARDEQALGAKRDDVIEEVAPEVAAGRLRGRRIGLIALGELPGTVSDPVEKAIDMAGGKVVRRAVLAPPEDTAKLYRGAFGPIARVAGHGTDRQARLGTRIGRLFESGNPAAARLRRAARRRFSGSYAGPVDAVVVYRNPPPTPEDDAQAHELDLREAFEDGVLEGLRDDVVGVETLDTDPSQVDWYFNDQVVASVDNVDVPAGQLALVLLLEDAAVADVTGERPEGRFGYKDSADRALPDLQ
jgi:hypothetical protein